MRRVGEAQGGKIVSGEYYRGAGLKEHVALQAVEVEPCYCRHLGGVVGFTTHDGG